MSKSLPPVMAETQQTAADVLRELVARLEGAKEGSGELSWQIAEFLGWSKYWNSVTIFLPPGATEEHGPWRDKPPAYTTSLDAALSLVPEGWRPGQITWSVDMDRVHVSIECPMHGATITELAEAATAPLAMCGAALRARQP